jgi:hypothetical protein
MQSISQRQLEQVAGILADLSEPEQEAAVIALLGDERLARRAIDWLVEAFGLVLLPHIAALTLPNTFKARSNSGEWVEFPFSSDPIFIQAIKLGTELYHQGQHVVFGKIALRSAMVIAVNKALNAGADINGGVLGPPSMIGLKAEMYRSK